MQPDFSFSDVVRRVATTLWPCSSSSFLFVSVVGKSWDWLVYKAIIHFFNLKHDTVLCNWSKTHHGSGAFWILIILCSCFCACFTCHILRETHRLLQENYVGTGNDWLVPNGSHLMSFCHFCGHRGVCCWARNLFNTHTYMYTEFNPQSHLNICLLISNSLTLLNIFFYHQNVVLCSILLKWIIDALSKHGICWRVVFSRSFFFFLPVFFYFHLPNLFLIL